MPTINGGKSAGKAITLLPSDGNVKLRPWLDNLGKNNRYEIRARKPNT